MAQDDYEAGAVAPQRVDGVPELFLRLQADDARGRPGYRHRRRILQRDPRHAHPHGAAVLDDVRPEKGGRLPRLPHDHICPEERERGPLREPAQARNAPVPVVVSDGEGVVAQRVHHLDEGLSPRGVPLRRPHVEVPRVEEEGGDSPAGVLLPDLLHAAG